MDPEAAQSVVDTTTSSEKNASSSASTVDKSISGIRLRRAEIVGGASTGDAAKFDQFPVDRVGEGDKLEVTIRPETVDKYKQFLRRYVTDLNRMVTLDAPAGSGFRNLREYVLSDPQFASNKLLVQLLSKDITDSSAKPIRSEIDEEAFDRFLSEGKEDNWAVVTALMEQHALMSELGLGINATINEQIFNSQPRGDLRGKKSAILDETSTLRNLGKIGISRAITGLAAAGYFLGGRGRTELDFSSELSLLQSFKATATDTQKAYLREVIKIDIDAIDVSIPHPGYTGPLHAFYREGYQPNIEDIEKAATNDYVARKEFLKQFGIDESSTRRFRREIDRSVDIRFPEEFIFDSTRHPEGLLVRYSEEIMLEYRNIVGTATGRYERLAIMAIARETVMVRYLQRELDLQEVGKQGENITALTRKKEAMKNNPAEFTAEKKKKLDEERKEAEKQKTEAAARKTDLVDPLPAKIQAVLGMESEMFREFELPVSDNFEGAVAERLALLKSELVTAKSNLTTQRTDKAKELSQHSTDVFARFDAHTAALKTIAASMATLPAGGKGKGGGPNVPSAPNFDQLIAQQNTATETRFQSFIEEYQAEVTELTAKIKALEDKQREYQRALHERETATITISAREPGQLKLGQDAFDGFITPALCTEAELRTLTVDELAEKLSARVADPKERIRLAMFAKAEAKGREEQIPNYQKVALAEVTDPATGISMDDMFRSVNELGLIFRAVYPSITPDVARGKILTARLAAERMLQVRFTAKTNIEIEHYGKTIEDIDKRVEKLGDFKEQIAELDAIIHVMEGEQEVFENAYDAANSPVKLASLSEVATVTSADSTYSEAERNAGLEKGYYEWMKLLYPDYEKVTNRDEVFEVMHRILSPEKLAELLNTSFSLGIATPPTLNLVFTATATRTLNGVEIQEASKRIINFMRANGLAQ